MQEFYTLTMLLSIATFTITSAITPGPNNIMLLSSGLTFGYKRSIPHMSGIIVGFPLMVMLIGLGMGYIFEKFPSLLMLLKYVGAAYLIWMAYKIANNHSAYEVDESKQSQPFTFLQGAMFQWVNPKAWIMAMTAMSIFITNDENNILQVFIISTIFFLSAILSSSSWTVGGVFLKKFIKDAKAVRILNTILALLLLSSILPFIFE